MGTLDDAVSCSYLDSPDFDQHDALDMEKQTLTKHELEHVFTILEKEQPNARDQLVFRLFTLSVYCWAAVYVLQEFERWVMIQVEGIPSRIADFLAENFEQETIDTILQAMYQLLGIASIVLFVLSLRLVRKLWRQGRAGRRLQLSEKLESLYRRRRRRRWIFVLVMFILVAESAYYFFNFYASDPDWPAIIHHVAAPAMLCIYLITMYFVRRGKEQFELIRLLQRSLQEKSETENITTDHGINIAEIDYDQIAVMERRQIIHDRRKSIRRSKRKPDDGTYVVQKSRELIDAMDQLDSAARIRVENRIFELMSESKPEMLATDSGSRYLRLRVPETELELTYEVDGDAHRIKIYSLETLSAGSTASPSTEG